MPITFPAYILHMVVSVMLENKLDSLGNKYPSNWAMSGNSLGSIPVPTMLWQTVAWEYWAMASSVLNSFLFPDFYLQIQT